MPISSTGVQLTEVVTKVSATGACYVCFEDGAPRSLCKCTDRFVHAECLVKQVQANGRAQCPVCLEPYTQIVVVPTRRITRHFWYFLTRCIIVWILLPVGVWRCHSWLFEDFADGPALNGGLATECVIELVVAVMMGLCVLMDCVLYRRGGWSMFETQAQVTTMQI
jgi:hypothetical protein